jgi:hypothetical protein
LEAIAITSPEDRLWKDVRCGRVCFAGSSAVCRANLVQDAVAKLVKSFDDEAIELNNRETRDYRPSFSRILRLAI